MGSGLFDLNAAEQIGTNRAGRFLGQPERAAQTCHPSWGVKRGNKVAISFARGQIGWSDLKDGLIIASHLLLCL